MGHETASKDSFVSIEKAKVLGYKSIYSNKDALCRNYQWYLENMSKFTNDTGYLIVYHGNREY